MLTSTDAMNPNISNMAFETYVLNVLRDYLSEQNKNICQSSSHELFDATLPDGIDDIPGPLYLEVKSSYINKSAYFRNIERFALQVCTAEPGALLIVLGIAFTDEAKQSIVKLAQSKAKRKVYVWDIEDFNNRTQKFQSAYSDFEERPTKAIVDDVINRKTTEQDTEDAKELRISSLKTKYQSEELTLFLGAGVSIDAGVPLWRDLINQLLAEMILRRTKDKENAAISQHFL